MQKYGRVVWKVVDKVVDDELKIVCEIKENSFTKPKNILFKTLDDDLEHNKAI